MTFAVTFFDSVKVRSEPSTVTFDSLEALLDRLSPIRRVLEDEDLPEDELPAAYAEVKDASEAWSPASPFEGLRASPSATASVLVYDFDGLTSAQASAVRNWLAPYRAVAHTSPSHRSSLREGLEAWRVVVELASPALSRVAYAETWMALSAPLREAGVPVDKTSTQIARKYYYGLSLRSNLGYQTQWVSPGALKPAPAVASDPVVEPLPSSLTFRFSEPTDKALRAAGKLRAHLAETLPPKTGDRHAFRMACASILLKAGWAPSAASAILLAADPSNDTLDCPAAVGSTIEAIETGGVVWGIPKFESLVPDVKAARGFLNAVEASAPRLAAVSLPPVRPLPGASGATGAPPDEGSLARDFLAATEAAGALADFLNTAPGSDPFEASSLPPPPPASSDDFDLTPAGLPKNTQRNLFKALQEEYICWTDTLKGKEYFRPRSGGPDLILQQGSAPASVLDTLARKYRISGPTMKDVYVALTELAASRKVDPLSDYLSGLPTWAGESPAILPGLVRGIANQSTLPILARRQVLRWLIATYVRGVSPGSPHATVLCLHGAEGTGKSSFLRALANGESTDEFFTDNHHSITNPEVRVQSSEYWISEWPEAEMLHGSAYVQVKAFLTSTHDTFRRPYDVKSTVKPRRTSIAITTNDLGLIPTESEARRFYVMKDARFPAIAWTARHRDQIWSEVKGLVALGLEPKLNPEDAMVSKRLAAVDLASYNHAHEEIEECLAALGNPETVKAKDVLARASLEGYSAVRSLQQISKALRAKGYVKDPMTKSWSRPDPLAAAPARETLSPTAMDRHPEVYLPEDELPPGAKFETVDAYRIVRP